MQNSIQAERSFLTLEEHLQELFEECREAMEESEEFIAQSQRAREKSKELIAATQNLKTRYEYYCD